MRLCGGLGKKDEFGRGRTEDESRKRGRRRRMMRRLLKKFGCGRGCESGLRELRWKSGWVLCLWIQWMRMKYVGGQM